MKGGKLHRDNYKVHLIKQIPEAFTKYILQVLNNL